jgi:hypothetical protein
MFDPRNFVYTQGAIVRGTCQCRHGEPVYLQLFPEEQRDRAFMRCGYHPRLCDLYLVHQELVGEPVPEAWRFARINGSLALFYDDITYESGSVADVRRSRGRALGFDIHVYVRVVSVGRCEVEGLSGVSPEERGYCYLSLYSRDRWSDLAAELGPWPLVSALPPDRSPAVAQRVVLDFVRDYYGPLPVHCVPSDTGFDQLTACPQAVVGGFPGKKGKLREECACGGPVVDGSGCDNFLPERAAAIFGHKPGLLMFRSAQATGDLGFKPPGCGDLLHPHLPTKLAVHSCSSGPFVSVRSEKWVVLVQPGDRLELAECCLEPDRPMYVVGSGEANFGCRAAVGYVWAMSLATEEWQGLFSGVTGCRLDSVPARAAVLADADAVLSLPDWGGGPSSVSDPRPGPVFDPDHYDLSQPWGEKVVLEPGVYAYKPPWEGSVITAGTASVTIGPVWFSPGSVVALVVGSGEKTVPLAFSLTCNPYTLSPVSQMIGAAALVGVMSVWRLGRRVVRKKEGGSVMLLLEPGFLETVPFLMLA